MIGRTVGHYRILERLGAGGMGVVYKAEDLTLGRYVALKFLPPEMTRDPEAKGRFLREARAASQLDHPNICTIHEIGELEDEQIFIAMAFYAGETLKSRIERGPLDVDDALKIAEQVARGLGKAHASGIVHRDIKPANVIVTSDGVAKILDFGLAKLTGATAITRSHRILGTLAYMAPEQVRGEEVGPQADLWSLGALLFELLTARRPFAGETDQAVIYAILNQQPSSLGELRAAPPPELDRIIRKLLRKDPLQRYQTAEEVLGELETLRAPSSGSGRTDPHASKPREPLRAGARLGPYEIAEPLGSGGMGDVYRARDTRLDRQVAIKVLAPEFLEDAERKQRFQREAKTISSLSHPNICTLFDVGEQEGTDYLVMEYLEGETLADRLTRGALPLNDVLKIGIQIGEALGAAHRQGVIHRDLKPGNVMLTKTGAVKLVDFGLAKDIGAVTSTPHRAHTPDKPLTAEGAIVGTLAYMAPEQVEGREADARTDIFAFGAILYEMATGKRAFEGATKASLIAAILEHEPPMLAAAHGATEGSSHTLRTLALIEHLVVQCLEKDPDRRWQSAIDVAAELRWLAGRTAVGSRQGNSLSRVGRVLALVLITAIATGGGWYLARLLPKDPDLPRFTQLTFRRGNIDNARFSPDGATIYYSATWDGAPSEVFAVGRDGSNPRSLGIGSAMLLSVSVKGELAILRFDYDIRGFFAPGTLARVSTAGGLPRDVADRVVSADWIANGEALAVVRVVDGRLLIEAPVGNAIYEATRGHTIYTCRVSPDGSKIAFIERSPAGDHLKIIGIRGEAVRLVGPLDWSNRFLSWSPDGREVVMSGRKRSGGILTAVAIEGTVRQVFSAPVELYIYDIARDGSTLLDPTSSERSLSVLDASASTRDLSWLGNSRLVDITPSGNSVLFTDRIPGSEGVGSYIRRLDGSPPTLISVDRCFAIAPDGSFVLAISQSGPEEMLLIPTGSGDARKLGRWKEFRWGRVLPNGKSAIVHGSPAELPAGLYRVALETGTVTLIPGTNPIGLGAPSPDSRMVGVMVTDGLAVLDLESSAAPQPVPGAIPGEWIVGWSADNRAVLTTRLAIPVELHRVDLSTGKRATLQQLVPKDSTGFMGQAASALAANDGKIVVIEVARLINSNLWIADGIRY